MTELTFTPTLIIAIIGLIFTLLTAFAGVVAGFVRIESKTNVNTADISELFKHSEDRTVHHPADELDRRFSVLDVGVAEIKKGIDKINDRFDKFFSK